MKAGWWDTPFLLQDLAEAIFKIQQKYNTNQLENALKICEGTSSQFYQR